MAHTEQGADILRNFIFKICGCSATWDMGSFIEYSIQDMRKRVNGGKVLSALSGGVDSSVVIKSHHNVGGLPERMHLKLIVPVRELFKDEVRLIGKELEIPQSLLYRHPFPGPGLAIRILGEITSPRLELLREEDAIILERDKRSRVV